MFIEVEESPNCGSTQQFEYKELGKVRPVRAIIAEESAIGTSADSSKGADGFAAPFGERGKEVLLNVTGVARGGKWVSAQCVKIADSGAGFAFLIFGGEWGIRLKPSRHDEAWDLNDPKQWGEPFKIYGEEKDIIYEN